MGIFSFFKRKKKRKVKELDNAGIVVDETTNNQVLSTPNTVFSIVLEQLPTNYTLDDNNLVEITDSDILNRINELNPSVQEGSSIGQIIKKDQALNDEVLYRVVLKNNDKIEENNKETKEKKPVKIRPNGISQSTKLIKVVQGIDNSAVAISVGSSLLGIASLVVGQYYMKRVDTQLSSINHNLSKVIDFLDIEYRSEVASLMESVYNISKFQFSSVNNEELRARELSNIQELKKDCQKLLYQAETTLEKMISKTYSNFDNYESTVKEIDNWNQYQMILVKLLYEINILDFTFNLGIKSKEQCFGSFSKHTEKIKELHDQLDEWHEKQCNVLKIDINECRRKHTGVLGLLNKPISVINDKWNYKKVDEKTIQMIKDQTAKVSEITYSSENLFDDDVVIIAKKGKYYYLPGLDDTKNLN